MSFMRVSRIAVRRVLPRTLFMRTLLIVALPMLLVQGVSAIMFYERHWDNVRKHMAIALANDVAFLTHEVQTNPPEPFPLAELAGRFNLIAEWREGGSLPPPPEAADFPYLNRQLYAVLHHPFLTRRSGEDSIAIYIALDDGVLWIESSRKRIASSTTYIYMLSIIGASVFFLSIAILFLRNQVRPIQQLADAAEKFGKGQDAPDFQVQGAQEVRRAAQAFLIMRERIKRQMEKRTRMLAAISHDLRTPLTRMKLQLALMQQDEAKDIAHDIEEMEGLISEYLDFVRGEGTESTSPTDLAPMLEELVRNYAREDKTIALRAPKLPTLSLRPTAFRRCLTNLLDNAFRYGTEVEMRAKQREQSVHILIDDNGPGIPLSERSAVLQAFHTLDKARHKESSDKDKSGRGSGVGLGLSIAKDIVLSHGGTITLEDAPIGGLRVHIQLPV